MVTYCVQREVNIGTEGEVIPEEELIELVQSCDLLENSPVYRKMKQYQNIARAAIAIVSHVRNRILISSLHQ